MRSPTILEEPENVAPETAEDSEPRDARPGWKVTSLELTRFNLALTVPDVVHGKVP